jgi:hypothetical protein
MLSSCRVPAVSGLGMVVPEMQFVWLVACPVHLHCLHSRDGWPTAMTRSARLPPNTHRWPVAITLCARLPLNTHRWPAAITLCGRLPPYTQCTNLATCLLMQAAAQEVAARPPWK